MAKSTSRKAFVTGWPVEHSRSPMIHGHWLSEHGIDGSYERVARAPEDFDAFIAELADAGFAGGNVTIPHKERAFGLVDHHDETAKALGAVNTIWRDGGTLWGGNTDGYGFLANLDDRAPRWDSEASGGTALVVGAGGASRAIILALQQRGFGEIVIANRTLSRAEDLAVYFGKPCRATGLDAIDDLAPDVRLVVNTTSLGMEGGEAQLPINVDLLASDALVTDIVYTPLVTPLLAAARNRGLRTVDGLGMLLHQAVPGFEKWFGVRPEVTVGLRNLLLKDLGEMPDRPKPLFLGLTGSIGMGKSTTAQMFRNAGIPVHDADATVHELYAGEAVPLVEVAFPGTSKDGMIDRAALSKFVVGDEAAMKKLEAIVHPLVHREEMKFRKRIEKEGHFLAILDAPLLFEMGTDKRVDGIVVVTAPPEVQRQRVLERPDMNVEKFEAILARQTPDEEKRQRADFIIDTSEGLDAARAAVVKITETVRCEDWVSDKRKAKSDA